jgi:signal transduction histidine kinase
MESNVSSYQVLFFFGFAILIMLGLAVLVVYYGSKAQKRLLQEQMQRQTMQLEHQQQLLQHNLTVQEEERQRIAAQLHDDIGSKLGVLHLTFHRLRRMEAESKEQGDIQEEINQLISNTLATTRRISHELLPPTLEDFGLIEALKEFCEGLRKTGAIEVDFEHPLEREDLPDTTTQLHLFRIVQELSNNTLKYAHAKRITLRLEKQKKNRRLVFKDDGQGFSPSPAVGLGLKNIENRVNMIGATWSLHSAPGAGMEAVVVWRKVAAET